MGTGRKRAHQDPLIAVEKTEHFRKPVAAGLSRRH